ncbi:MAG: FtsX-like permease family protein [Candidatus Peregrinibacteria bacterium]|nr:FtsX-like permease family protein [Candidatus Peregrinibacteria bacterium]
MFVAVTERTREIGLRKALGATRHAIMMQFLWEALLITFVGALIGVVVAVTFVYLVVLLAVYSGVEIAFFIPVEGILIAILAALVEGVFFGLYPARKAASLNPIESLRYE